MTDFPADYPRFAAQDLNKLCATVMNQKCSVMDNQQCREGSDPPLRTVIRYPKGSSADFPGPMFDAGCMLVRHFQEPAILSTRVTSLRTFQEVWQDDADFRRELLSLQDPASAYSKYALRRKYHYGIPASFIPCIARTVYDVLANKLLTKRGGSPDDLRVRVLDPCAGWGDRLVGAFACPHVKEYVGVDPNPATQRGYAEIAALFSAYVSSNQCPSRGSVSARVVAKPFEKSNEEDFPNEYFDIVFTSPPYLDYEVYSREVPSYTKWDEEFYEPLVERSRRAVTSDGIIAFHIDDTSAGNVPRSIRDEAVEVLGVDIGFDRRIVKVWILNKEPKVRSSSKISSRDLQTRKRERPPSV